MYIWHKSDRDPMLREQYRIAVEPTFRRVTGLGLSPGSLYLHGDTVMEVHRHKRINADHIAVLSTDKELEQLLVGGGEAVPVTWQPVVDREQVDV